ncbi:uncharacterized protein V1510DRAFT_415705 [Dipodascopsis tothii]|uniref:uncharacterized protein n=1 Tax=Dipodascopsis tothii TaxID=44089 RepID=UPI0034CDADA3
MTRASVHACTRTCDCHSRSSSPRGPRPYPANPSAPLETMSTTSPCRPSATDARSGPAAPSLSVCTPRPRLRGPPGYVWPGSETRRSPSAPCPHTQIASETASAWSSTPQLLRSNYRPHQRCSVMRHMLDHSSLRIWRAAACSRPTIKHLHAMIEATPKINASFSRPRVQGPRLALPPPLPQTQLALDGTAGIARTAATGRPWLYLVCIGRGTLVPR